MRDLLTLIEGAQWAKHHVIPAGTMLFHGTDDDDFHPSEISGPAWFSTDNDVAEKFAGGRLLAYRLKADLKLPLITTGEEMEAFAEKFGIDRSSSEDVRDTAKRAGIPGWIIPDNYEPGDDILICDMSNLEAITSDLGDLQESVRNLSKGEELIDRYNADPETDSHVEFHYDPAHPNELIISWLEGHGGSGARTMRKITALADKLRVKLALMVEVHSEDDGGKLVPYYRQFGFFEEGDVDMDETPVIVPMFRKPGARVTEMLSPSRDQRNQMFDNKTRSVKVTESHPVFGKWPKVLRDNREIASYVSDLDPRVDEEMIEEHYFGCHAVLKLIPIESVKEGPADSNIRSASKEKKFAKMDLAKQPPILVEDGVVLDGNHRYRVAKAAGATDILAYVISYDEPITEGAATDNYLYHGTSRRALGSIRIHGLTPKESKRSRFGASYKLNSDGRIFFTDDLNKAEWYAKDLAPSNPAILRVKKNAIRDAREDTLDTRSFYITHSVPPQEIEVLGARGWVRIAKPVELDERQTLPLKKGANDGARSLYGAFVCVMQPSDFLRLTTDGDEHLAKIHKDEFTDLQTYAADTDEKYGKSKYNMPFLFIEHETGRVTGHEGRHRAAMVERAGGRSFPCMIVFKESEKWRLTYEKASRTGHVDDELVQEFFPSEAKVDQRVDTLRSLNSLDQFDFYYEEFKIEQVTGKGTMKGSPRSDGWDYDSWKTQDIPEKFIGQFDPMVVIPTLRMKFGPVKGYRHFKS